MDAMPGYRQGLAHHKQNSNTPNPRNRVGWNGNILVPWHNGTEPVENLVDAQTVLGANTTRVSISAATFTPDGNGGYTTADRFYAGMAALIQSGIQVVATVYNVPQGAGGSDSTAWIEAYSDFLAWLATTYHNQSNQIVWEVYNEFHGNSNVPTGYDTVATYLALCQRSRDKTKHLPGTILAGGAETAWQTYFSQIMNGTKPWTTRFVEAGIMDHVDILSWHLYTRPNDPSYPWYTPEDAATETQTLIQTLQGIDDRIQRVAITETGFTTSVGNSRSVDLATAERYTYRQTILLAAIPEVEIINLYELNNLSWDQADIGLDECWYGGPYTLSFTEKMSWVTTTAMIDLCHRDLKRLPTDNSGAYVMEGIGSDGQYRYAAWVDDNTLPGTYTVWIRGTSHTLALTNDAKIGTLTQIIGGA